MSSPAYAFQSWSAVISRAGIELPKPRKTAVQANIAAFAAARLCDEPDADSTVPRLYRIMSRPHVIPGSPGAVRDVYISLCPCLSCKIQKERRALRTQHLARIRRSNLVLAIRTGVAVAGGDRCVSHSLDTGCAECVRRVAEGSSSEGSPASASDSSGGISGVSDCATSSTYPNPGAEL